MSLDGWTLNEKLKKLEAKMKRHENIIGALAQKVFALENKSPSKKKVKKDAKSAK